MRARPFKSIARVSQNFNIFLTQLVNDAWATGTAIKQDMRLIVRRYVEDAYFEGMLGNGASPDALTDEDRKRIDDLTATQDQYVAKFAQDVKDARGDTTQQDSIRRRIELWTQSIEQAGELGRVAALRTRKAQLQWHTANDELTCEICAPLNGTVVKAGESFGEDGDGNLIYSSPAHFHCRCQAVQYVD